MKASADPACTYIHYVTNTRVSTPSMIDTSNITITVTGGCTMTISYSGKQHNCIVIELQWNQNLEENRPLVINKTYSLCEAVF